MNEEQGLKTHRDLLAEATVAGADGVSKKTTEAGLCRQHCRALSILPGL